MVNVGWAGGQGKYLKFLRTCRAQPLDIWYLVFVRYGFRSIKLLLPISYSNTISVFVQFHCPFTVNLQVTYDWYWRKIINNIYYCLLLGYKNCHLIHMDTLASVKIVYHMACSIYAFMKKKLVSLIWFVFQLETISVCVLWHILLQKWLFCQMCINWSLWRTLHMW